MKIFTLLLFLLFITSCSNPEYKWTSIGDSITWQNGRDYKDGSAAEGYQDLFIKSHKKEIFLDNQGFSGLPLSGSENSISFKLKDYDFKKSKLITIFVGTNDFKLNNPLQSFHECLEKLILNIKSQNPHAKIYLFTPLQRNKDGFNIYNKNAAGFYLNDYRNEILKTGRVNNIPVIDLYHESGITIKNLKIFTLDGLHPNNRGYIKINSALLKHIIL